MKTIPIQKTILATLAFAFSNWKKLLEVSIFPLLLALPFLPELMNLLSMAKPGSEIPDNINFHVTYLLMFIYASMAMLINVYRLVILGNNSVNRLGFVLPNLRFGRFFLLAILLGVGQAITLASIYLLPFYLLLVPLTLNLVSIANDVPYKRIEVTWQSRLNIFLINFIGPFILISLIGLIENDYLDSFFSFISIYWTSISIALCYKVIMANSSTQSH
ncbi:MAG: hypothetical protein OSA79_02715 [Candidatus Thioglobus sp.]|jgi:hypothetical protein|nr:hypothetical protein [Candidatus Thioglobus sp.]|tara:strand:- start:236 stop:889 length:654 start_codon:yes stop_codon:yes gene_type:complete